MSNVNTNTKATCCVYFSVHFINRAASKLRITRICYWNSLPGPVCFFSKKKDQGTRLWRQCVYRCYGSLNEFFKSVLLVLVKVYIVTASREGQAIWTLLQNKTKSCHDVLNQNQSKEKNIVFASNQLHFTTSHPSAVRASSWKILCYFDGYPRAKIWFPFSSVKMASSFSRMKIV